MTFAYLYGECQQELEDAKLTIEILRDENEVLRRLEAQAKSQLDDAIVEIEYLKKKIAGLEAPVVRKECPDVGKYAWVDSIDSGLGDSPMFDTAEEAKDAAIEYMFEGSQEDCHIVKMYRYEHSCDAAASAAIESLIDGIYNEGLENPEDVAYGIEHCEELEAEISDAIEKILIQKGLDEIVLYQEEYALDCPPGVLFETNSGSMVYTGEFEPMTYSEAEAWIKGLNEEKLLGKQWYMPTESDILDVTSSVSIRFELADMDLDGNIFTSGKTGDNLHVCYLENGITSVVPADTKCYALAISKGEKA